MFSERLIQKLKVARKVAVLTGAGISAESGVPTFRGEEGLWKKYRPEELATPFALLILPLVDILVRVCISTPIFLIKSFISLIVAGEALLVSVPFN